MNGFCSKIELFLIAVVHKNCVQKNRLFNILDRKQSIQDQKIEVLTRVKKWTIFNGVSPWILSKNRTFSYRRFLQKSYRKTPFFILYKKKNDFKEKKIGVLQKDQKWTFCKGVSPWILSKNRTFSFRRFLQKSYQKTSF